MAHKQPMSQYGIGPFYSAAIIGLTAAGLIANHMGMLPVIRLPLLVLPAKLFAGFCLISAVLLWFNAAVTMNIRKHIRENELVTTGAYAWVRNPIYSAFMLAMWGLLLWSENLLLLLLAPVYPFLMTLLLKRTEEVWLAERYGSKYQDYCRQVNRCIPCPPRKKEP